MITVVPSTPYFALATQIYDTAPHMLDINWAPIVGALVVSKKAWDDMSPEVQTAVRAINLHDVPEKITIDKSGANTAAIESVKGTSINSPQFLSSLSHPETL